MASQIFNQRVRIAILLAGCYVGERILVVGPLMQSSDDYFMILAEKKM